MEHLGYIFETPKKDNYTGDWSPVELTFDEQENFHTATSKLIKTFKHPDGDGKCTVIDDGDGQKYLLDITHVTFDSSANSLKVFPVDCRKTK